MKRMEDGGQSTDGGEDGEAGEKVTATVVRKGLKKALETTK